MKVTRPTVVKREKYLLCGTDPCRVNRQTYTHTRAWLIPPNGGPRTVSHSPNFRIRSRFIGHHSLSLSLENKYLSPRFNPWPQFAAAKDLAIFEPCALLPGRDAEDPWKVGL